MTSLTRSGVTVSEAPLCKTIDLRTKDMTDAGQALAWTFTATALVLTAGRFIIRYKRTSHKLQLDDVLHGLAALVLVAYITTYTISFSFLYPFMPHGIEPAEPPSDASLASFIHRVITISATFWVTIYLIKFSFLVFYYTLFGILKEFIIAWWIVLAYTIVTFLANFIAIFWSCGTPEDLFNLRESTTPPRRHNDRARMI